MSTEYIWETFDSLFKTVYQQGRRVEELETRIADLEQRLKGQPTPPTPEKSVVVDFQTGKDVPAA
jgi:BMFP domain-containing protein YqiC